MAAPVGSIPTRSRQPAVDRCRVAARFGGVLALFLSSAVVCPVGASGQVPIPQIPTRPGAEGDTVEVEPFRFPPPISPLGALGRSILLPGWGQAVLDRRVTGAVFVLWEGISLAMTLKSRHQLNHFRRIEAATPEDDREEIMELVAAKEAEFEDWAILLAFNHLLAGAEAYVAAQLWDFPNDELRIRALPQGRFALTASIRW